LLKEICVNLFSLSMNNAVMAKLYIQRPALTF